MNTDRTKAQVRAIVERCRSEGSDDADLLADMLEGSTDYHDTLSALMDAVEAEEANEKALADQIAERQGRKKAIKARIDRYRDAAGELMDEAGDKTVKLPECTLSRRAGRVSLRVTDEAAIPALYKREVVSVEIDKAALQSDLANGTPIDGAALSNGAPTLSIRRKA